MKKPTVYLETSTISAFWYEGADVAMLARRLRTREWWELERRHFALWASAIGDVELRAGTYPRQDECVKMMRRLRYLTATSAARELQEAIMRRGLVPPHKKADAAQLERLCQELGILTPLMVSPESIPQVRFGQSIRRDRKHG